LESGLCIKPDSALNRLCGAPHKRFEVSIGAGVFTAA
jgi:hypothetical protein